MKRINRIIGSSLAGLSGSRAVFRNSDYEGRNKMPSRIVLSMCFVFLLMLFVNTPLGHAESTGPSDRAEVADPTSGHPCTAKLNQQRYVDYLTERKNRIEQVFRPLYDAWIEDRDALISIMQEIVRSSDHFLDRFDDSPRPMDTLPYPHACDYNYFIEIPIGTQG